MDEPPVADHSPRVTSQMQFTPSFKEAMDVLRLLIEEHFPPPLAERWAGTGGSGGLLWLMRVEMALIEDQGKAIDSEARPVVLAERTLD